MKHPRVLHLAAVLTVLASATPGAADRGKETSPLRLTIAFTGDVSGYLEPCG
jgi:hypothetical protein